ncbi:uncharacterized protein LOC117109532 [Anneissia japonica]|uniref:uncharacterized protein LOC117109532 n=1 Tax=Anneissia japonica TaxID=1529436 RepID=UPI001425571D|nr:uncharacterized protein LOC117109532 [Anneissia japonica]
MAWFNFVAIAPTQTTTVESNDDNVPLNLSIKKEKRKKEGVCLRQPNWTDIERKLLTDEFMRHRAILSGGNDSQSKREKRKAWEAIRQKVSQVSTCKRTLKEVRKKWHNICFYESKRRIQRTIKRSTMNQATDCELKQEITISPYDQTNESSSVAVAATRTNDVTDCDAVQSKYMSFVAELEYPSDAADSTEKTNLGTGTSDDTLPKEGPATNSITENPTENPTENIEPDSVRFQQDLLYLHKQKIELERCRINIEIDILEVDRKRLRIEEEMINRKLLGAQTNEGKYF